MECSLASVASRATKVRSASTWVLCLAMFVALSLQGCWSSSQPKAESDSAKGRDLTIPPDAPPPQQVENIDLQESGLAKLPGDSRAYSNPSGDLATLENENSKALPDPSRLTPDVITPPVMEHDIGKGHAWLKEPTMEETREEDKRRILGIGSDPTDIKPVEIENPVVPLEAKSSANSKLAANSSTLDVPTLMRFTGADEAPAARDAKRDSAENAESKKKAQPENQTPQKVPAEDLPVHQDAAKHAEQEGTHPHDPLLAAEHVDTAPHPPHPVAAPTVPAEDLPVYQDAAKHAEQEGTHPHDPLLAAEHVDTAPHPPHPVAAPTDAWTNSVFDVVPAEDLAVHQDAAKHAEQEGTHPHDPLLAAEHVDTAPHPPHPVAAPTEETASLPKSPPQNGFGTRKMGRHADLELEK